MSLASSHHIAVVQPPTASSAAPHLRLQRYLKPKYERQYNAKAAIYGQAKKRRMALVEAMMADSHITPF